MLILAVISVSLVVGSSFAIGLIRAKPPGDPNSVVVDICGPGTSSSPQVPPTFPCTVAGPFFTPGDATALVAGTTSYAWGLNIPSGAGTFGPGVTTLAITIVFNNGCPACTGFMNLDPVKVNGRAIQTAAGCADKTPSVDNAAVFGARSCGNLRCSDGCTTIDLSGIANGALTIVVIFTPTPNLNILGTISNGVNRLDITVPSGSQAIGISAIRAVITI